MRAPLKQRIKEWFCKHFGHKHGEIHKGVKGYWTCCKRCGWVITINHLERLKEER